jgi:hypothetical protein
VSRTLASIGAAIILLSLPLDLFFQQIVAYPTVWTPITSVNATVGRAVAYNPAIAAQYYQGEAFYYADNFMNANTQPFFYDRTTVPSDPRFDCPTTNCTFTPFDSMAVVSQCVELNDLLYWACQDSVGDWMTDVIVINNVYPVQKSCGWWWDAPGVGATLMTGYNVNNVTGFPAETMATRLFPLWNETYRELIDGGSLNFKDVVFPIADFIIAQTPGALEGVYKNNTPIVHECELHWVVQRIESSIFEGNLTENFTTYVEMNHQTFGDDSPWMLPVDYKPNFTLTLPDPHSSTGESTYRMDNITARRTIQLTDQMAPMSIIALTPNDTVRYKWWWITYPPQQQDVDFLLHPFVQDDLNISDYMSQIARTMTNTARSTRDSATDDFQDVDGIAWKEVVMVDIRWVWITLPAALLLFSLLFLVATVVKSTKQDAQVGVWKTSALAVLFNGLGEDVQNHVGAPKTMGYARERARDIKVKLEDE